MCMCEDVGLTRLDYDVPQHLWASNNRRGWINFLIAAWLCAQCVNRIKLLRTPDAVSKQSDLLGFSILQLVKTLYKESVMVNKLFDL